MKEFWKTGVALLVLVGLGLYIWKYEWGQEVDPDGPKETILAVEKDAVAGVSDRVRGGRDHPPGEGRTAPGAWPRPSRPPPTPRRSTPSSIASRSSRPTRWWSRRRTTPAQYGLEPAGAHRDASRWRARTRPGSSSSGRTPREARRSTRGRPSSPRIYTVASFVESSFDKKPFDLRDRDLLHAKRDDVRTLEVDGPGGRLQPRPDRRRRVGLHEAARDPGRPLVGRRPPGHPREPADGLGGRRGRRRASGRSASTVRRAPSTWCSPTARRAPSRSGAAAGDDDEGKYHAREAGSSLVAVIPGGDRDRPREGHGRAAGEASSSRWRPTTPRASTWCPGGSTKTFAKSTVEGEDGLDKTQWKRTAPDEADLETTTVEDALFKMGGVEVQEFVDEPADLGAYGLDAPVVRVTVRAKTESWIELGRKGEDYFARRSGDDAVLRLDPAKAAELLEALEGALAADRCRAGRLAGDGVSGRLASGGGRAGRQGGGGPPPRRPARSPPASWACSRARPGAWWAWSRWRPPPPSRRPPCRRPRSPSRRSRSRGCGCPAR